MIQQEFSPTPVRVFLSSTYYDLSTTRTELEDFLKESGYEPILFETASSSPFLSGPDSAVLHATSCDICILIVGTNYGSINKKSNISFTHNEYRSARDNGRPIFVFIDNSTIIKFELYLSRSDHDFWTEEEKSLFNFIKEISAERSRFSFTNLKELRDAIKKQLNAYYGYLLRCYSGLDSLSPSTSSQWLSVGNMFWNVARFGQAIYCYRRAMTADEQSNAIVARGALANALRIVGRSEEALEVATEGIKKNPQVVRYYVHASNCLCDLNKFDEALKFSLLAAEKFPNDPLSWDSVRYVYSSLGQKDKALEASIKAHDLIPEDPFYHKRLIELSNDLNFVVPPDM